MQFLQVPTTLNITSHTLKGLGNIIAKYYLQKMQITYAIAEKEMAVLLIVNVYKHVSFTRLM